MEEKQASLAVVELVKRLDSVIQVRGDEGDGPGQREEQVEQEESPDEQHRENKQRVVR